VKEYVKYKTMKKYFIVKFLIIATIFLIGQESEPFKEKVHKLNVRLQLTDNQINQIIDVFKKELAIKEKDQELFKTDAVKLINAAHERRKTTNQEIEKVLTSEQKEEFKKVKKMTLFDRELFELTEGLLLTSDQAFDVEGVLIDLQNKFSQFALGGPMPGRGEKSGAVSSGYDKRMKQYMAKMRKRAQKKKNNSIKEILNKDQKKLFKQILKDRENKRKARG
jgi:hypothetical protein